MTGKTQPWYNQLKREFHAQEGSFLLELRCDLRWNSLSFERLIKAMEACCKACAKAPQLERWMAEGFYYLPGFIKDWSAHEAFPKEQSRDYFNRAYEILDELAHWYFHGEPLTIAPLDLTLPD